MPCVGSKAIARAHGKFLQNWCRYKPGKCWLTTSEWNYEEGRLLSPQGSSLPISYVCSPAPCHTAAPNVIALSFHLRSEMSLALH